MAFALSGTTITQSGTDFDLSGLSGITGVEYKEHIASASVFRLAEFSTGIKLRINGNLTIDASTDQLFFPHTSDTFGWLEVTDGASLTLTDKIEKDGTSQSYQKIAIRSMARTANHYSAGQGIDIKSGGTLVMDGGGIWTDSHINFWDSRTLFIVSSSSLIRLGTATNGLKNILRGGTGGASFDIDGLMLLDSTNGFQTGAISKLNNYSPQFCDEGVMANGELTMYSYDPVGCDIDFSVIAPGSFYVVYGYADKPVTFTLHFDHNNAAGGGWVKIRKKLQIITLNEEGLPIEGVKSYFTDTDNGERQNKIEDLTGIIVYEATSDSSGLAEHDILLANSQLGSYENVGRESEPRPVDYRTKNNSHDYKMDAAVFSYGHHPRIANDIDLRGLSSTVDVALVLSADPSITEPDRSIVDAYAELDTPQRVYDRAKSWLVANYQGETTTLVALSGGTLTSNYSLIIDPSVTEPFAFDGSTIIIRATTFTGDIALSSGAVTLLGGATIDGAYTDTAADSTATIGVPAGKDLANCIIRLYASYAEADADTQADGSSSLIALAQGENSIRYNSADYGGQTLAIRIFDVTAPNSELIGSELVPVAPGNYTFTVLSFSSDKQLARIEELCTSNATALGLIKAEVL